MIKKMIFTFGVGGLLLAANWTVQNSNTNTNQLVLTPSGDFNVSEGNFSVENGNGFIKNNLEVGKDVVVDGTLYVLNPLPHLEINSTTITEGDDADLSITLYDLNEQTTTSNNDIVIHYKTINGGAIAGDDYYKVDNNTITLKAGDSSVVITIKTIDDNDDENNRTETAFVKIWLEGENHKYATTDGSFGVIGITDNDAGESSSDDSGNSDDGGGSSGGFIGW